MSTTQKIIIDFYKICNDYREDLNIELRDFGSKNEFMQLWVPSSDLKKSLCNLIDALKETKILGDEVVTLTKSRRDLPKIPFGELVEQGIIPPGAVLTDKKEKFKATVSIDGSLKIKDISGSIHQVGAKVQGLPSCNGWDFWHVKEISSTTLLDDIRGDYRKKKIELN